jgi:hypothetical protein
VTLGGKCCLLLQSNGLTSKMTLIFFDLGIPLYDGMTAILMLTVNSTMYWCLLNEHISTHVAEKLCLNKHQNLFVLSFKIYILIDANMIGGM